MCSDRLGTPPNATVLSECASRGRCSSSSRTPSSPHYLLKFLMSLSPRTHSRPPLKPHLPSPLSDFSFLLHHIFVSSPRSVAAVAPASASASPPHCPQSPHHTVFFFFFLLRHSLPPFSPPSPSLSTLLLQSVTIFSRFSSLLSSLCPSLPLISPPTVLPSLSFHASPCSASLAGLPFFPRR